MERKNTYTYITRAGVLYVEPRASPTIKAVKGTIEIKAFSTIKRALGSCYGGSLTGPSGNYGRDAFPLRAAFSCLIVGLGPGAFNCQGFRVSLRI